MTMHNIGEIVVLPAGMRYIDRKQREASGTPGQYVQIIERCKRKPIGLSVPPVIIDFGSTHRTFCDDQAAVLRRLGIDERFKAGRGSRHSLNDGWRDAEIKAAGRKAKSWRRSVSRWVRDVLEDVQGPAGLLAYALCAGVAVYAVLGVVAYCMGL